MKVSFSKRLRRAAARRLWPGGHAVVLLYHRIADEVADPYGLCVSPRHFEEHLEAVRVTGRPMHLEELARAVRKGKVPQGAVCLTFDDGYVDNLEVAKPLLERYDVPATVFMTTGRAGRDREFWWDELERVFFEPALLPAHLSLEVAGVVHTWDLAAAATFGPADLERAGRWHLLDEAAPSARHRAFREAYALIQPLLESERTRVLDALLDWADIDPTQLRPSRRALEPDEVVQLARGGIVEIGAHTVSHPALPSQSAAVQRDEIRRSKADVESWLARPVPGFAYPYGQYDETSVIAAREAGFVFACSCDFEAAWRASDPHLLPRFVTSDTGGDGLVRLIGEAVDGG